MMVLGFEHVFHMEGSLFERGSVALIDPRPRIGALTCCSKMTTQNTDHAP